MLCLLGLTYSGLVYVFKLVVVGVFIRATLINSIDFTACIHVSAVFKEKTLLGGLLSDWGRVIVGMGGVS